MLLTLSATHNPGLPPAPHTYTQQVVCSCRHRGPYCGGPTVWHCGIAPAPIHSCCMRAGGAVWGLGCRHGWLCHRPVVQCRTSHDHQRQVSCCVPSDFLSATQVVCLCLTLPGRRIRGMPSQRRPHSEHGGVTYQVLASPASLFLLPPTDKAVLRDCRAVVAWMLRHCCKRRRQQHQQQQQQQPPPPQQGSHDVDVEGEPLLTYTPGSTSDAGSGSAQRAAQVAIQRWPHHYAIGPRWEAVAQFIARKPGPSLLPWTARYHDAH